MIARRRLIGTAAACTVLAARPGAAAEAPVAHTHAGSVRGAMVDGIACFKGIRYGADTAGGNRFRPPQPVKPWRGVRDALEFAPMAPAGRESGARLDQRLLDLRHGVGRELSGAQPVDARPARSSQAAGDGVVPWRWLLRALGIAERVRRHAAGAEGRRRGGDAEPPAERVRLPVSRPVGAAIRGFRDGGDARPGGGAALGARQHR